MRSVLGFRDRVFLTGVVLCAVALSMTTASAASAAASSAAGEAAAASTPWTVTPTPNPTFPGGSLAGVTCLPKSPVGLCIAVGSHIGKDNRDVPFVETRRNGHWRASDTPLPAGDNSGHLTAVTCPAADHCLAVGDSSSDTTDPRAYLVQWSGAGWAPVMPPSRLAKATLTGISCSSRTACLVVGTVRTGEFPESSDQPVFARWNGATWVGGDLPVEGHDFGIPGVTPLGDAVAGISCPSATRCVAVGNEAFFVSAGAHSTGIFRPFADIWDGLSWSSHPLYPADSGGGIIADSGLGLTGVSCPTTALCLMAGSGFSGSEDPVFGDTLPLLRQDSWQPGSVIADPLSAVSCVSASLCVGVGDRSTALWKGTNWTTRALAGIDHLAGVSCLTATHCVAVGSSGGRPAAATLSGTAWTARLLPVPAGQRDAELLSVSCASKAYCLAVGTKATPVSTGQPIAQRWNGTTWSLLTQPMPASSIADVSCPAVGHCVGVGMSVSSSPTGIALVFDGSGWQAQNLPAGMVPASVSCPSPSSCFAVGTLNGGPAVATAGQNGHWQRMTFPSHPANEPVNLTDVSCPTTSFCLALGHVYVNDQRGWDTFVAELTGSAWILTHGPSALFAKDLEGALECTSAANCVLLAGQPEPGAASWNGQTWTGRIQPAGTYSISALSCVSSRRCFAAGYQAGPSASNPNVSVKTARILGYDGVRWVAASSAPLPAGTESVLAGIDCVPAGPCLAVGATGNVFNGTVGRTLAERRH
jgi:hypothetical protein